MTKKETHLARLAAYADVIMQGGMVEQVGAICFRTGLQGSIEVLLVTTRETGRWTIPKGWAIKGLKSHEAAEREAWEEAGVKGKARKSPLGYFTYLKTLDDGTKVPSLVEVHLVEVKKAFTRFPESKERSIEWLSPVAAAARVSVPELKGLLMSLMRRSVA
ncbi:NUDIX hydrolase [Rhizobium giardinii]|uniref:NUDIX hydrolase n=1 Tax=Rhizobium giardinii TaxID=56731 RepID=UPI0039E1BACC